MKEYIEKRAITLAYYIIENNTTVRAAAKHFGYSKSSVHKDVTARLSEFDPLLAISVKEVLDRNKAERHIRGGQATKLKFEKKRNSVKNIHSNRTR